MNKLNYDDFLQKRMHFGCNSGFEPIVMPDHLFGFQKELVEWALLKGRGAIFADCGLGKTAMQLAWAENVIRKTNKPVLILTPLAVGAQTVKEAAKFGHDAVRSLDGKHSGTVCVVANYERLHYFDPSLFGGVVCDESSILKNADGATKAAVTQFMLRVPYRLLATATAAPNDFIELGTSSEALGYLGFQDMITKFFKKVDKTMSRKDENRAGTWRFRGHSEQIFWKWVCSWARAIQRPSDMGYSDDGYDLPPVEYREHVVRSETPPDGFLFALPACGLSEQRGERKRTIEERCELAADLISARDGCSIAWCYLNAEGDMLEKLIPGSVQISGNDPEEWKDAVIEWFTGDRCICGLTAGNIRSKLAVCGNQNTQLSAEQNTTPAPPKEISEKAKGELLLRMQNTCGDITPPIPTSSCELQSKSETGTPPGDPLTPATNQSESPLEIRRSNGRKKTLKSDSLKDSSRLESRPPNIGTCSQDKAVDAQFAEQQNRETPPREQKAESADSTLTTAIPAGKCGESCAQTATSDSVNSEMMQRYLKEHQCSCGHKSGKRVMISKPTMFGFGLNLQCCAHMTFFPSHSFEQLYQAVSRSHRFGQTQRVVVDVITSEGEAEVMKNIRRKQIQAQQMFARLVELMHQGESVTETRNHNTEIKKPSWLS